MPGRLPRLAFATLLASGVAGCCSGEGAKFTRVAADFHMLAAAVKTYQVSTGHTLPPEQGLEALVTRPPSIKEGERWTQIATMIPKDPWGNPYRYLTGGDLPEGFGIYSCGPDGKSGSIGNDADDWNTWRPDQRGITTSMDRRKPWLWLGAIALALLAFLVGQAVGAAWQRRRLVPA